MTATFLELSTRLAATRSTAEKKRITKTMGRFLGEEREFADTLLRPLMLNMLAGITSMEEVLKGDYFTLRQRVYRDEDGEHRVALGIAFLQDHLNHQASLDEEILWEVQGELERHNLELLVNDLTVNRIQMRNGFPTGAY